MRASHFKNVAGLAGVISLLVGTAGCGGGGGGGNNSSSNFTIPAGLSKLAPGVTSTITPTLLPLISGDEWYYAVTGETENSSGVFVGIKNGSLTRTISNYISNGTADGVSITDQLNLYYQNNTPYVTDYIENVILDPATSNYYDEWSDNAEASGNQEYAGNDNCPGDYYTAMAVVPITWNTSTGISSASSYFVPTGGQPIITTNPNPPPATTCTPTSKLTNQEQFTLAVVGTAPVTITVPAGTFQTWKVVTGTNRVTQGTQETATEWWAPQIGTFVQKVAKVQNNTTGAVSTLTYQLLAWKSQSQAADLRPAK